MIIDVLKPGLLTTIQDKGRIGSQKYGVIASGYMDAFAARSANIVVGNLEETALLEMTVVGPTLRFNDDAILAICGGDFFPTIDGQPMPTWCAVFVRAGSTLKMGNSFGGSRAYLAIAGGFDIPMTMGSRSTYLRAGIGGYEGRALQSGDVLKTFPLQGKRREQMRRWMEKQNEASSQSFQQMTPTVLRHMMPNYTQHPIVRVIRGTEYEWFDEASQHHFEQRSYRVLPQSDRMGFRLQGSPALKLAKAREVISEAVMMGTIQVPIDGNPIILMADRQTTGGYPKIAQVITVDLPLVAQLNPGSTVRFQIVKLEEAQRLYLQREQDFQQLKLGIRLRCMS